jgi:hypothetical protein
VGQERRQGSTRSSQQRSTHGEISSSVLQVKVSHQARLLMDDARRSIGKLVRRATTTDLNTKFRRLGAKTGLNLSRTDIYLRYGVCPHSCSETYKLRRQCMHLADTASLWEFKHIAYLAAGTSARSSNSNQPALSATRSRKYRTYHDTDSDIKGSYTRSSLTHTTSTSLNVTSTNAGH